MTRRNARFRLLVAVGVLVYASVLALSPVLHHDFQCHAQHPGHCDACRASVLAPGAAAPLLAAAPAPDGGGAVQVRAESPCDSKHLGRVCGRAPPASS